jgi:hypothetical protein
MGLRSLSLAIKFVRFSDLMAQDICARLRILLVASISAPMIE